MIDKAKRVKRGRLTNARTAAFVEFAINPSSFKAGNGVNLSEDGIIGTSHPLIRFASGKARTLSFSIQLDGEMTLRRRFPVGNKVVSPFTGDDIRTYNIEGELAFYRSFTFPVAPEDGGGLDKAIFNFGTYCKNVKCWVEDVSEDVTQFSADLDPVAATVRLSLKRDMGDSTVFSRNVWLNPYGA
jgi:hypothetical protein